MTLIFLGLQYEDKNLIKLNQLHKVILSKKNT